MQYIFCLSSFLQLVSLLFCFCNQFLLCVSCCLLACVFGSVLFFRITDKLLPFDLSILVLEKLCMN